MELVGWSPIQHAQTTAEFHRSSESLPHSEYRFLPTRKWGHCYCVLRDKDNIVVYIVIRSAEDSIENSINNNNNICAFPAHPLIHFLQQSFLLLYDIYNTSWPGWEWQHLVWKKCSVSNMVTNNSHGFLSKCQKSVSIGKRELDTMIPLRGRGISVVDGLFRRWLELQWLQEYDSRVESQSTFYNRPWDRVARNDRLPWE